MRKSSFGFLPDGREVFEYVLRCGRSECSILSLGASVRTLIVPDREGNPTDVLLGMGSASDQFIQDKYLGATVGRYANRIGGAAFTVGGKEYRVTANEGRNCLHGGSVGFDKQLFAEVPETPDAGDKDAGDSVTLKLFSPAGQEGFPGDLELRVKYTLRDDALTIRYYAAANEATPCSLTFHAYYNLSGHADGSIEDHFVRVFAAGYLPTDTESIPTGEISPVEGTAFDLRSPVRLAQRLADDHPQLVKARGFDHCFIIGGESGGLRPAAQAYSEKTGVGLTVYTDQPAVQFYTGNFLGGGPAGKGGAVYGDRAGLCFETGDCPDAPNKPAFPCAVLNADEVYDRMTVLEFRAADSPERFFKL